MRASHTIGIFTLLDDVCKQLKPLFGKGMKPKFLERVIYILGKTIYTFIIKHDRKIKSGKKPLGFGLTNNS